MILTQCAVCATELGLSGQECGCCSTRYWGQRQQHWKEGGHDGLKEIKRGGAEQQRKRSTRGRGSRRRRARDTKGWLATSARRPSIGRRGRARAGCSLRDGGFAHVSCLAEQAILFAEAEENNLDEGRLSGGALRPCEQKYHGVVLARSGGMLEDIRDGQIRPLGCAMGCLGWFIRRPQDALTVKEAELSMNGS